MTDRQRASSLALDSSSRALLLLTALVFVAGLTGCAAGAPATSTPELKPGATVSGQVMGGQQPIGGAVIKIYQTANTGYATGSTLLSSTTSDQLGRFTVTIPAVSCPASTGTYAPAFYATASGGDPSGNSTSNLNTQILLVSVFDTCATGQASFVSINELTTVAAAYALRGFTADASGTVSIGTSATNAQGFNDALANARLLVNAQTGKANVSTATLVLPTNMLNTIADILAYCVNELPATSTTPCNNLFAATTPPQGAAVTKAPADTFQAALNMAQYPGSNVAGLLYYSSSTAPYLPTVSSPGGNAVIPDLSLAIGFLNSTMASATTPYYLAIDQNDTIFSTGSYLGSSQLLGVLSSPANGAVYTTQTLPTAATLGERNGPNFAVPAFDKNSDLFIGDKSNAAVLELPNENLSNARALFLTSADGRNAQTDPNANIAQGALAVALDGGNDLFTSSYTENSPACQNSSTSANSFCQVEELPAGGTSFAATFNGSTVGTSQTQGMAVDANSNGSYAGTVWTADYNGDVHILTPGTGTNVIVSLGTANILRGIALDSSSNAWVSVDNITNGEPATGLYKIPAYNIRSGATTGYTAARGSSPSSIPTTASAPATTASSTSAVPVGGLDAPSGITIDAAGSIFIANSLGVGLVQYAPSFTNGTGVFLSPYFGFSPSLSQTIVPIVNFSVTAGCSASFRAPSNLQDGDTVTLSGFTSSAGTFLNGQTVTVQFFGGPENQFSATVKNCSGSAVATTNDTGIATPGYVRPALFTCMYYSGSPSSCANVGAFSNGIGIGVDKAGSVWMVVSNGGMVLETLGIGVPTDPILADGAYGVRP